MHLILLACMCSVRALSVSAHLRRLGDDYHPLPSTRALVPLLFDDDDDSASTSTTAARGGGGGGGDDDDDDDDDNDGDVM